MWAMPRKLIAVLILPAVALVLAGRGDSASAAGAAADPRAVSAQDPNPLAGLSFFVDRESPSYLQWRRLSRSGQKGKADLIWKIAREPKALWLGRWTRPNFAVKINRLIEAAKAEGSVPIFTVLRAEAQKCSPTYQGGGPAGDRATRNWYDDLARVIGDERVVIAFEPDSLGTIDCLARSRRDDRISLLRYGVDQLAELPNATVYLEAGASDWENAERTANQLRAIGIAKVRGFMLNATHSDWTAANIEHGLDISRLTGGKHFIINTAENGRGPVHYKAANGRRITVWCNPGLRGLGHAPTTATSNPRVDAYLWINRPGYAQVCQGRPIAWFLPRALTYARYATDWERPPAGTRFGHAQRYPPDAFGVPR
jgi:endoglucanase